jgi:hypothetical protein
MINTNKSGGLRAKKYLPSQMMVHCAICGFTRFDGGKFVKDGNLFYHQKCAKTLVAMMDNGGGEHLRELLVSQGFLPEK